MKKVLLSVIFASLFMPVFAGIDTGIDAGMTHLSLLGGAAAPISSYDMTAPGSDDNLDYGDIGPTYGIQIMHYLAPHFGLGAEFTATNYMDSDLTVGPVKYTTGADRYGFMLAGKFVFSPAAKTRFYIPVGGGFSRFKATMEDNTGNSESASCTKPAFYAGIGVESDLNDIFIFGIEGRYNGFFLDKDKFGDDSDYLDDAALLFKLGIKF